LTPKQKSEYLKYRSNYKSELDDYEYKLMSKEQLHKYYTNRIDNNYDLDDEDLEYANNDIIYYYINKVFNERGNLDVEEDSFYELPERVKNVTVNFKINNNLELSNAEKEYSKKINKK